MKVSLNWIKEFTDVKLSVDDLVTKIGAQLGAVEEVVDLGIKYQGIVVAKIVSCEPHPNADKLKVCLLDDGGITPGVNRDKSGYVQIVCGDPHARAGTLVAWIPPGVVVPSTFDKEPLKLEAREIRGTMSDGMLGTPRELAISDNHDGILEVDNDVKPGTSLKEVYELRDYIIDIENKMFTHRPDLFGQLGVAREIAGICGQTFKSPKWYVDPPKVSQLPKLDNLPLQVINEAPKMAPRFMAVVIDNIKIAPSPTWMQAVLARLGVRSINNIVDITNYMMHLSTQAMHAFDYHKIKGHSGSMPTIGPRFAREGEDLTLLGAKKIRLTKNDVVIATDKQAVDLAGIMGGADTEVDDNTTAIILTCSNFDMYAVRRSMMRHGAFTEAGTRNTKDQSPAQIEPVFYKTLDMMAEICIGAGQASDVFDDYAEPRQNPIITLDTRFINERLGLKLTVAEMATLLKNVEFTVTQKDITSQKPSFQGGTLEIQAPFWRTDIEIPEDIVEEVGRLYGYDHLPLELPKRDLKPAPKNSAIEFKRQVRSILGAAGANEVLTYSFVHGNLLARTGQKPEDSYQLSNALSPDLQYYRQTLTPSLLDKVHSNIKAGYDEFALFELNKTHNKIHGLDDENIPGELNMIALTYASKQSNASAAYYQARKYLDHLASKFGFTLAYDHIKKDPGYPVTQPFDLTRSALVTIKDVDVFLGIVGEYRTEVAKNFKLPPHAAGFEIGLEALLEATKKSSISPYRALPRFPKIEQDISLKVPTKLLYSELHDFVWKKIDELKPPETLATIEPIDIYQRKEDKEHKQISFRLTIASYERTMTAEEVNTLLDRVAESAKTIVAAERV